jgi:hypothetical protein
VRFVTLLDAQKQLDNPECENVQNPISPGAGESTV